MEVHIYLRTWREERTTWTKCRQNKQTKDWGSLWLLQVPEIVLIVHWKRFSLKSLLHSKISPWCTIRNTQVMEDSHHSLQRFIQMFISELDFFRLQLVFLVTNSLFHFFHCYSTVTKYLGETQRGNYKLNKHSDFVRYLFDLSPTEKFCREGNRRDKNKLPFMAALSNGARK